MAAKKIRVHELAKELGMTNAEVLDLCGVLGVAAKGPSSSLQEAYASMVRRRAERDGLTRDEQPEEPKPQRRAIAKKREPATKRAKDKQTARTLWAPPKKDDRLAPAETGSVVRKGSAPGDPPTPPRPIIVVDGANLANEGRPKDSPSLNQLQNQLKSLRIHSDDARIFVYLDRSMKPKLTSHEQNSLEDLIREPPVDVRVIEVAPGQSADVIILLEASSAEATVVSNDSFKEYQRDNQWLFQEGRLLGCVEGVDGWNYSPRRPVRPKDSRG